MGGKTYQSHIGATAVWIVRLAPREDFGKGVNPAFKFGLAFAQI